MRVTNILWDTDGESVDLPTEVDIIDNIDEDEVADYLSDEYGYLVESFFLPEKENEFYDNLGNWIG